MNFQLSIILIGSLLHAINFCTRFKSYPEYLEKNCPKIPRFNFTFFFLLTSFFFFATNSWETMQHFYFFIFWRKKKLKYIRFDLERVDKESSRLILVLEACLFSTCTIQW